MRHQMKRMKISRTASHRTATLRNLTHALIEHGRITTTLAKAKAVRPFAEKLVTKAVRINYSANKQIHVHFLRQIRRDIQQLSTAQKLVAVWGAHFMNRPGGYTRIVKLGNRPSDAAPMAFIEFIGDPTETDREKDRNNFLPAKLGEKQQAIAEIVNHWKSRFDPQNWVAVAFCPPPEILCELAKQENNSAAIRLHISPIDPKVLDEFESTARPPKFFFSLSEAGHRCVVLSKLPQYLTQVDNGIFAIDMGIPHSKCEINLLIELNAASKWRNPIVRLSRQNGATVWTGNLQGTGK